jgi:hypothetical protein
MNYNFTKIIETHRKKITTGLVELAAVMATDKVSRKARKATKAFFKFHIIKRLNLCNGSDKLKL